MKSQTEEKLRRLTRNQAKALTTFITKPSAASGATGLRGPMLGGTMSALERAGTVSPLGKEGRQFRWEITDPDIAEDLQENRKEIIDLLERISGNK